MTEKSFEWLPLDNAGKVFPGQNSKKWSNVFRMSVQLKEEIKPDTLKEALKKTLERIPGFKVRMRNGFFANYLERNEMECPVRHDIKNFCYRINFKENNGYLFRVYYHKDRISIDVYHALCDGYGASVFLCTLAGEYLRMRGYSVSHNQFVLDVNESPQAEEYEDAYERYATSKDKSGLLETNVYHKKGSKMPLHMCNYTAAVMSFSQIHALSKRYDATVTEFLAAVLLEVLYEKQLSGGKIKKDVSVQIPVNLRKAFPSRTLRNFVICLSVKISPRKGEYTFDEIVRSVSQQLREINNKKHLHAYITNTVKLQTGALKIVPLAMKNTAVKIGFSFGAEYSTSVLLSNFGAVIFPEDMKDYVEGFYFYTGPGLVNGARCGAVSVGDKLALTFSDIYRESDIERAFMKKITDMGSALRAETNRDTDFSDVDGVQVGDKEAYSGEVFVPSRKDIAELKKSDLSFKEKVRRYFFC